MTKHGVSLGDWGLAYADRCWYVDWPETVREECGGLLFVGFFVVIGPGVMTAVGGTDSSGGVSIVERVL